MTQDMAPVDPTENPKAFAQHLYYYEFQRCECGDGPGEPFSATVAEAKRVLEDILEDHEAVEEIILGTGSGRIVIDPPAAWTDTNGASFPANSVLKLPVYTKAPQNDGRVQNRTEQLVYNAMNSSFDHVFAPVWDSHPDGWWCLSKRFETGSKLDYGALEDSIQTWATEVSGQQLHPESEFLVKDNLGTHDVSSSDGIIVDYGSYHPEWFINALFNGSLPIDASSFRDPLPKC